MVGKSNRFNAHLCIIGANILSGVNFSVAKGVMPDYIKPGGFTLLRVIAGASLFYLLSQLKEDYEKIERKDYLKFILAGLTGVSLNQLLFLYGLNLSSPIDSSIISTLNPAMVMLLTFAMLGEKISLTKIVGLLVGASGALMLILGKGAANFGSEHFHGNILLFLSVLLYALYLITAKPLMTKYNPVTVMRGVFTVGLFAIVPFGFTDLTQTEWSRIPASAYGAITFVLLGPTFLTYLLNSWGLRHVQTSTVSIYIYIQPVIAAAVSAILAQDTLSAQKVIAALLVFTGVFMVSDRVAHRAKAKKTISNQFPTTRPK